MTLPDSFRNRVERYLRDSELTPTDFSQLAARDAAFVLGLRRGRDCRLSTVDKVLRWMAENPPSRVRKERRGHK